MKMITIALIMGILILSSLSLGYSSPFPSSPPSAPLVPLGSFSVDLNSVANWGINAAQVGDWFSASWSTNQAEAVGAVNYPYQFLFGDLFQTGKISVQSISVQFNINWSIVEQHPAVSLEGAPGDGATVYGSPINEAISTGIGSGAVPYFSGYPVKVYIVNTTGSVLAEQSIFTSKGNSNYEVTLQPSTAANGVFYVEFYVMMYTEWNAQPIKYFPLYLGTGEFNQVVANVENATSLVRGPGEANLTLEFSGGLWNVSFEHIINGNASDMSPTNIQVLKVYNFSYRSTGGSITLHFNFSVNDSPGIYLWSFNESITHYGATYLVHDVSRTVALPDIHIWMSPGVLDGQETIGILPVYNESPIHLQVTIWYGNDVNLIPPASGANVLYFQSPFTVVSGYNQTISFKNTMDMHLNVLVIANYSDIYNQSSDFVTIGSNVTAIANGNISAWFPVSPFSSTLNELFLLGGVGLFAYSAYDSSRNSVQRKMSMFSRRGQGPGFYFPTHYAAAIFLIIMALVNWVAIYHSILNASNPFKGLPVISPLLIGVSLLSVLLGGIQ